MDTLAASESAGDKPNVDVQHAEKPQEETKFQRAISAWRSIDLANLVSKLDTTASDIVAHQRDSLVQRKDLAQKTKDFRRLDDASKLAEYKGLLKSYQAFIDLLTTHGKASSSAFLQLYSAFSEAPDPYPLLEASIDSLVLSEDTVPKLTAEKETLQKSVSQLTLQLEESEKKLEEERSLRRKLEQEQEKKIQGSRSILDRSDLEKTSLRLAEPKHRPVEEEPEYLRLQSENSSLLRKLESARFDKDVEKNASEAKLRQVERQNARVTTERDELRTKLEKVADYDDIRRELEIIKSIEFSTGNDDTADLNDGAIEDATVSTNSKENNLEQLLLARNKKLSNELTLLRVSHRDLESQLESLREELSKTNADLERSRNLTANLENDLLQVQKETTQSSAMSIAGTYTSRYPYSARRGRASPTSSIISGFDHGVAPTNSLEAIRAGEAMGGGSGILPMVQAQRDRFKQKNAELEDELSKTYATVKTLRQEIASLQKDNLNLYEKTRYISTYNRGGQVATSSSSSAFASQPHQTSAHVASDGPFGMYLDKYHSAYEAQISPFAAFRGRESTRAYKRMSLPERIIFSITRMVLANRTSRNMFAAYCLALHVLVFVMLYMISTLEVGKQSATLGSMAGVAAAQGGSGAGASPEANLLRSTMFCYTILTSPSLTTFEVFLWKKFARTVQVYFKMDVGFLDLFFVDPRSSRRIYEDLRRAALQTVMY
ncbi:CASP [Coccidioides immitis H538.4]|uniref:Protein CASP n=1 Tax=Coccidioides immitis H538.4 TaxID=396776 RepID=A0A0J8RC27_COCIT|nr:CASP [Coccidioides immitis H538.4]